MTKLDKNAFYLKGNAPKSVNGDKPNPYMFWKKEWGNTFQSKEAYELSQVKAKNEKLEEDVQKLKQQNADLKSEIAAQTQEVLPIDSALLCGCGFSAKSKRGLQIHKYKCEA